jgi:D-galactose 1-dehydrogenase
VEEWLAGPARRPPFIGAAPRAGDSVNAPLRLGLVGLGKIARDQHLPAIAANPALTLVATASRNAHAAGITSYHDLDAMLAAEPDLDAIILCQPPQARFTAARAALLAGKHVFLEKPPGATLSEVQALDDLAAEQGVTLFASWHSRHGKAVAATRVALANADISAMRIIWQEDVRVWHPGQEWIWQPGGFGVFDPGINALSILTEILPETVRLISAKLDIPSNRAAPIAAELALETVSGTPIAATFDFRQTGPQQWDIEIDASVGLIILSDGGNCLTIAGTLQPASEEGEYPALYARFVELVRSRESDVDIAPLQLVADAFLVGDHRIIEPFDY